MPGKSLNDTERKLLKHWNADFRPALRTIEITGGSPLRGLGR